MTEEEEKISDSSKCTQTNFLQMRQSEWTANIIFIYTHEFQAS